MTLKRTMFFYKIVKMVASSRNYGFGKKSIDLQKAKAPVPKSTDLKNIIYTWHAPELLDGT